MAAVFAGYDSVTGVRIRRHCEVERIGSDYGGWFVPRDFLTADSVCYCAGVGEDITFDLGLIERFGCDVYAFDPTPRSIAFVQQTASDNRRFHFLPIGLWDRRDRLRFYSPSNPDFVSHSILNLAKTDTYFEADCDRLSALLKQNGHREIDLLKLDIEGAEYTVLDSIVEDQLRIPVLCVEFDEAHSPIDDGYKSRIKASIQKLLASGYTLIALDKASPGNYTFMQITR